MSFNVTSLYITIHERLLSRDHYMANRGTKVVFLCSLSKATFLVNALSLRIDFLREILPGISCHHKLVKIFVYKCIFCKKTHMHDMDKDPFSFYSCTKYKSIRKWIIEDDVLVNKRKSCLNRRLLLSRVTFQFDRWPRKTIRHIFYVISRFVHHFLSVSEFKLEQSCTWLYCAFFENDDLIRSQIWTCPGSSTLVTGAPLWFGWIILRANSKAHRIKQMQRTLSF